MLSHTYYAHFNAGIISAPLAVWDLSPSLTTPGNMITADTWNWYSAPFCSMPTTPQLALPGNCTGEVGPCLRLRPLSGAEMREK